MAAPAYSTRFISRHCPHMHASYRGKALQHAMNPNWFDAGVFTLIGQAILYLTLGRQLDLIQATL
eukprot:1161670-Pelagomonas_calceolata.AAC.14